MSRSINESASASSCCSAGVGWKLGELGGAWLPGMVPVVRLLKVMVGVVLVVGVALVMMDKEWGVEEGIVE